MKSMKFSESLQKKTAQTPISFEVLVYQAVLVPIWAGYLWFKGILSPQLSTNMGVRTPSNHSHQKPNNIKHQIRKSELQSGVEDIGAHFFFLCIFIICDLCDLRKMASMLYNRSRKRATSCCSVNHQSFSCLQDIVSKVQYSLNSDETQLLIVHQV